MPVRGSMTDAWVRASQSGCVTSIQLRRSDASRVSQAACGNEASSLATTIEPRHTGLRRPCGDQAAITTSSAVDLRKTSPRSPRIVTTSVMSGERTRSRVPGTIYAPVGIPRSGEFARRRPAYARNQWRRVLRFIVEGLRATTTSRDSIFRRRRDARRSATAPRRRWNGGSRRSSWTRPSLRRTSRNSSNTRRSEPHPSAPFETQSSRSASADVATAKQLDRVPMTAAEHRESGEREL